MLIEKVPLSFKKVGFAGLTLKQEGYSDTFASDTWKH
jgi:hypothetical protein